MGTIGINFRNTLAFVTDPAGTAGLVAGSSYPTTRNGITFGGQGAAPEDSNASFDARIAGRQTLNTWNTKPRIDLVEGNGIYRARCALGEYWGTQPGRLMVWDGVFGDGVNADGDAGNVFDYAASSAVGANKYTVYGSNLYCTTAGGTTGASSPPTHTSGTVSDNSVAWTFVKSAVFAINVASPANVFTDAAGASYSAANWPASNGWSPNFTLTNGFVTLTKHTAGNALIRHFALDLVSATLAPLIVRDRSGKALTELYTGNPEGTTVAKFTSSSGANAFTLTGTAASYYEIVARNGAYEIRAKVGAGRMPSSASSGTLGIIQTDASATNGPSQTTWVVKSTGALLTSFTALPGRDTETNRHDMLLDSKTWAKVAPVISAEAGEWRGYQGQAFATDVTVSTQTALLAAWNAVASGRDGVSWYRIAISGAGWAAAFDFPAINMGSGGLLIEPAAGQDPLCEWKISSSTGTMRRVHFRGLRLAGQSAGGRMFQFAGAAVGGQYGIVKFSGNRIGRGFAPGYNLLTQATTLPDFVTADTFEQLICEYNEVRGVSMYMGFASCFYVVTRKDDVTDAADDAFAPNTAYYNDSPRGIFADDDCRFLQDSSSPRAVPDVGHLWTDGKQPHPDNIQYRDFQYRSFWAASKDFATSETPAGTIVLNPNNDNLYTLVTRGVSAASGTGPSGTGTGIVDGGCTWNYFAPYRQRGRKMIILCRGSYSHAGGVDRGTTISANLTIRQWLINSHMAEAGCPLVIACVNCASFSFSSRGLSLSDNDYGALIHCTMAGPGICPTGSESVYTQNASVTGGPTTEAYVSGSILGPSPNAGNTIEITMTGGANMQYGFDQGDNLAVDWRYNNANSALEPSAALVGPSGGFGNQGGVPIYSPPIDISATADAATFWSQMLAMARPISGNYGVLGPVSTTYEWTELITDAAGQAKEIPLSLTVVEE